MAGLVETVQWEDEIYQLETTDPVEGGPEGIDNKQAKQLANRTAFLRQEHIKSMLFMPGHSAAVGRVMDTNYWVPATGVILNRSDYPSVFAIVETLSNYTDQATIDANPEDYAGYWGDGDGSTTFTSPNIALVEHIKAAGTYGSAGSYKADHIQNITGSVPYIAAFQNIDTTSGPFYWQQDRTIRALFDNTLEGYDALGFDASLVVRTDTYTDTMGVFFDLYIFCPKGTFTL